MTRPPTVPSGHILPSYLTHTLASCASSTSEPQSFSLASSGKPPLVWMAPRAGGAEAETEAKPLMMSHPLPPHSVRGTGTSGRGDFISASQEGRVCVTRVGCRELSRGRQKRPCLRQCGPLRRLYRLPAAFARAQGTQESRSTASSSSLGDPGVWIASIFVSQAPEAQCSPAPHGALSVPGTAGWLPGPHVRRGCAEHELLVHGRGAQVLLSLRHLANEGR